MSIRGVNNSRMANSNAMGVSPKIINGITKAIKRLFNIRNPSGVVELISKVIPCISVKRIRKKSFIKYIARVG